MDQNLKDILDTVIFIKDHMLTKEDGATKTDLVELRFELHQFRTESEEGFRSIRVDLAAISKRLDTLEQQFADLKGVTKEIDEIRDRVRGIEKHLGLNEKITA